MISVVVLAFNSADFVSECIDSVLNADFPTAEVEIVVLDNASSDHTWSVLTRIFEHDERVTLLHQTKGLGFAGGCNYAARHARGDILLFLNDDCAIEPDCLQAVASELADAPGVVVQCAVAVADGSDWNALGHFLDLWGFLHQVVAPGTPRQAIPSVGWRLFGVSGAAFAIRKTLFDDLGGFDEDFQFLFEETDLCWRALLLGAEIVGSGIAVVRHRQLARYRSRVHPSAFYLETRNRFRSLSKNLEARHAVVAVTVQLISRTAFAIMRAFAGKPEYVVDVIRAIGWNLERAPRTWQARRHVQSTRRVSDRELQSKGLLLRPRLRALGRSGRDIDVASVARH